MLARQNIKICAEMQGKATSKSDMFVLGAPRTPRCIGAPIAPMASPLSTAFRPGGHFSTLKIRIWKIKYEKNIF